MFGNDRESGHEPGMTIQQVAEKWAADLIKDMRAGEVDEGRVYGATTYRAVEFVLAGGGPGATITFLLDGDEDVHDAFYTYMESGGFATVSLDELTAAELYSAFGEEAG